MNNMKHQKLSRTVTATGLLIAALFFPTPQAQANPLSAAEFFTQAGGIGMLASLLPGCVGGGILCKYNSNQAARDILHNSHAGRPADIQRGIAQQDSIGRRETCDYRTVVGSAIVFCGSFVTWICAGTIAAYQAGVPLSDLLFYLE